MSVDRFVEAEFKAWVVRYEKSLRRDYHDYATAHDYDLEGPMSFDSWTRREFGWELDERMHNYCETQE